MKGKFFLKKDKKKKGKSKKKIIIIAISLVTVFVVIGGVAFFALRKNGNVENPFSQMMGGGRGNGGMSGMTFGSDMVTASGVINVGTAEESFDVENLSTRLQIEEVYVSAGETIEIGAKVMKISEESIVAAREELESTLASTQLAYRAGVIEYEQNKISAKYDYDSAVLAGEQAEEIYWETIAGLDSSVEKAKEELADTKAKITEYESYVNDSSKWMNIRRFMMRTCNY